MFVLFVNAQLFEQGWAVGCIARDFKYVGEGLDSNLYASRDVVACDGPEDDVHLHGHAGRQSAHRLVRYLGHDHIHNFEPTVFQCYL